MPPEKPRGPCGPVGPLAPVEPVPPVGPGLPVAPVYPDQVSEVIQLERGFSLEAYLQHIYQGYFNHSSFVKIQSHNN